MPSPNNPGRQPGDKDRLLLQYAGMATQFLVAIGISLFIGLKADQWLGWRMPVMVWALPLLVIIGMIYSVVRNSSKK